MLAAYFLTYTHLPVCTRAVANSPTHTLFKTLTGALATGKVPDSVKLQADEAFEDIFEDAEENFFEDARTDFKTNSNSSNSDDSEDELSFQNHTLELLLLASCRAPPVQADSTSAAQTSGTNLPSAGFQAGMSACISAKQTSQPAPLGGQTEFVQAGSFPGSVPGPSRPSLSQTPTHPHLSQAQAQTPVGMQPDSSKPPHNRSNSGAQTPTDSCARLRAIRASAWYFAAYYEPFHCNINISPTEAKQPAFSRNSRCDGLAGGSSSSAKDDEACAPKRLLSFGWIAPVDLMRAHQWVAAAGKWEDLQ